MKNLKIRAKLIVSFAMILCLFVVSAGSSVAILIAVQNRIDDFNDGACAARTQAFTAKQYFEAIEKNMLLVALDNSKDTIQAHIDGANASAEQTLAAINALRKNAQADDALLKRIIGKMGEMNIARAQVLSLASSGDASGALQYYKAAYVPLAEEVSTALDELLEEASVAADDTMAHLKRLGTLALILQAAIAAVGLGLAIWMCRLIIRGITGPVDELRTAAAQIAAGNLKVQIDYCATDELGDLADSMRNMAQTLNSYVSDITRVMRQFEAGNLTTTPSVAFAGDFIPMAQSITHVVEELNAALARVKEVSNQVAGSADQLANGSQQMAQGASEQAGAIEELAASINEIAEQVHGNAQTSGRLNKQARGMGQHIEQSNAQMLRMVGAMEEINTSAKKIGQIIKTIEDIAFQTNILALNAAIEAARAGAAGRGFSVVADEVRNLAAKSDEAAKSTEDLVKSTVSAVQAGAQIAGLTASSLEQVVAEAEAMIVDIESISRSSEEQALAIAEVRMGVEQISTVVQTNSATAQESAAASEELSGLANVLEELLHHFKLEKTEEELAAEAETATLAGKIKEAKKEEAPAPVQATQEAQMPQTSEKPAEQQSEYLAAQTEDAAIAPAEEVANEALEATQAETQA